MKSEEDGRRRFSKGWWHLVLAELMSFEYFSSHLCHQAVSVMNMQYNYISLPNFIVKQICYKKVFTVLL